MMQVSFSKDLYLAYKYDFTNFFYVAKNEKRVKICFLNFLAKKPLDKFTYSFLYNFNFKMLLKKRIALKCALPKQNREYTKYELRTYQIGCFSVHVSCTPEFALGERTLVESITLTLKALGIRSFSVKSIRHKLK